MHRPGVGEAALPGPRASGPPKTSTSNIAAGAPGTTGRGPGALLHAGNDIRSRGRGPMELRGRKYKRGWMHANQAIYRVGGGVEIFRTDAQFHFFDVGYEWGGSYWKVHNPLSMEIWSLDEQRRPLRRLRKGPKVFYCFRDLEHTRPMRRSPRPPRLRRLQPGPGAQAAAAGDLGRLVGPLPLRLRPPVGQRRRAARLLRLRHAGRPAEPVLRVQRARQPLGPDRPPALPGRPSALLSRPHGGRERRISRAFASPARRSGPRSTCRPRAGPPSRRPPRSR